MKAVQFARHGHPPDVVEVVDVPAEPLGADDLRLDVEAAAINNSHLLVISGVYGFLPDLPAVPGLEGLGRVVEIGANVTGFKLGDLVMLPAVSGTWRQQMVKPASSIIAKLPADGDLLQMAMLMANPTTAYRMLKDFGDLGPGDWVIQNAGNSAVGGYLIQLAHAWGICTANIVRRDGLEDTLAAMGADAVVVTGPDLAERVAAATGGAAIRVGIDAIGGAATAALASCLANGGTVVSYGLLSGEPCELSPTEIIFREITLTGFWLNLWLSNPARAAEHQVVYSELAEMIAAGQLHAEVEATYPLSRVKEACAHALTWGRAGKIILTPQVEG